MLQPFHTAKQAPSETLMGCGIDFGYLEKRGIFVKLHRVRVLMENTSTGHWRNNSIRLLKISWGVCNRQHSVTVGHCFISRA